MLIAQALPRSGPKMGLIEFGEAMEEDLSELWVSNEGDVVVDRKAADLEAGVAFFLGAREVDDEIDFLMRKESCDVGFVFFADFIDPIRNRRLGS